MLLDQTDTWIMRETIQPRLLFRNLHVLLDHDESQSSSPTEIANLFACDHLDSLNVEICTPESVCKNVTAIINWFINQVIAHRDVLRQLRERSGVAVKLLIEGPPAIQDEDDITWMLDRPEDELANMMQKD